MPSTGESSHRPRPRRPRLWQRAIACVLMLTLQVSSFAHVAVSQQAAGWIGANTDVGSFEKYAAHALLGCGAGAAKSGSADGCAPAAAGAVIGHLSADSVKLALSNDQDPGLLANMFNAAPGRTLNDNVSFISGLIGGTTAVLIDGGQNVQGSFNLGQSAAENAVQHNYLKYDERKKLEQSKRECFVGGNNAACATVTALKQKDELSDKLLAHAAATCKGADCVEVANFARQEMATLGCHSPMACPDHNTLSAYWSAAQTKAQGLETSTPEMWLLDGKAVLDLGKLGIRALASSKNGGLDALAALSKTSADDLVRIQANARRDDFQLLDPVGVNSAAQTNLLTRIAQDGHALERHGGGVTDQQLRTRALTGVAPDGSSVVRNGQTVIPPSSTAFHSDALLVHSDQFIRQNYLDRAIALSTPGAQRVTVEGVDMGINIGRGFDRVSSAPGAAGPLQFNSNLSRATAVYSYDAAAGVWRTVTIYPVK